MALFQFRGARGTATRPATAAGGTDWAKNATAPGSNDGTVIDADLINDIVGALRAIATSLGQPPTVDSDHTLRLAIESYVDRAVTQVLHGAGAPDDETTGSDGDFYIRTDGALTMYGPKFEGAWPAGVPLEGADGADGKTILTGAGTPSNGTGQNGDVYFDSTAKRLHTKSAGVWDGGVSLVGAPGSPGTNGTNGTNGTDGDTFNGTSTSSVAIGTGSKTFATQATLDFVVGMRLRAIFDASNWAEGTVTAWSGGSVTINVDKTLGSGTRASWTITVAGLPGADGVGSGDVTAAAAFANDNRLLRSDGTGKGAQASGITVSDADAISGAASVAVTGDPTTAMQLTTKQYVDGIVAAQDAMVFKGVVDCSANPNYSAADRGHTYRVSVAGKIGGGSGPNVESGDILMCLTDSTASGNHATVGSSWAIIQANIDGALLTTAIGVSVQAYNTLLTAIAGLSSNGIVARTASGTSAARTITAGPGATVSNGDGVSGNPTVGPDIGTAAQYQAATADKMLAADKVWAAAAPVTLTDGATITPDFGAGINFVVTLGGNRTLANPTNAKAGQSGVIIVKQDGTGSRTLSWGTNFKWPAATAPTLSTTASRVDKVYYFCESSSIIHVSCEKDSR